MNTTLTLEELGSDWGITLEVEVNFDYNPEEPMVRYYPDGSGYPGAPAEFSFNEFTVTKFTKGDLVVNRSDRPDWFSFLDLIAEKTVEENKEYYEEIVLEEITHEEYSE